MQGILNPDESVVPYDVTLLFTYILTQEAVDEDTSATGQHSVQQNQLNPRPCLCLS